MRCRGLAFWSIVLLTAAILTVAPSAIVAQTSNGNNTGTQLTVWLGVTVVMELR